MARRSRVALFVALVAAVLAPLGGGPLLMVGCAGSDCEGDTASWGSCRQGELAGGDLDTWESGPITGQYLDFHGERLWTFDPTPWMGNRVPSNVFTFLSLDPYPTEDGGGFAQSAGNLAEVTPVESSTGWQVQVLNDTCAQYYLRVVVVYAHVPGETNSGGSCAADGGT